jgi:hypothetical protein
MSIDEHIDSAFQLSEDFQEELSSDDVAALRDDLSSMGESAWVAWVDENRKAVFSILGATPEKRAKRKDWADPLLRRRLCFAVYHQARLAALVLSLSGEVSPGRTFSPVVRSAAHLADQFLKRSVWTWPFDCEPPFPHWFPPRDFVEVPFDRSQLSNFFGAHVFGAAPKKEVG